jgi:hypothetical protein
MKNSILKFLFYATSGPNLRRNVRGTLLGVAIGLLAALLFGALLYTLNRQQRL